MSNVLPFRHTNSARWAVERRWLNRFGLIALALTVGALLAVVT